MLRKRCERRLRNVWLPRPFDVKVFVDRLAAERRRSIHLIPMALGSTGPCGLLIATEGADYIVYEQATSRLHQEHIVLHEIGHLLCRHEGAGQLDDGQLNQGQFDEGHAQRLFRTLDPQVVRRMLFRASYPTVEECEAEMIASLILQRAHRTPADRAPADRMSAADQAGDPGTVAIIERLEAGMLPPRGRPR